MNGSQLPASNHDHKPDSFTTLRQLISD